MKQTKKFQIAALFLMLIICIKPIPASTKADNGALDLSHWNWRENPIVRLDGVWEFYWKELRLPDTFVSGAEPTSPDHFITLPLTWNNKTINGKNLPGEGFATFRLRVLLPEDAPSMLSLRTPEQATAYRIFVDGKLQNQVGLVADNPEEGYPDTQSSMSFFPKPDKTYLEIIMHISNYDHRSGGVWHSLVLGPVQDVIHYDNTGRGIETFLAGLLLIMALYHFGLFFVRRNDRSSLLFAVFCLFIFLRLSTTGTKILPYHIDSLNYYIYITIEYLTFFFSISVAIHFLYTLFPNEFHFRFIGIYYIISIVFSFFTLATKPQLFSQSVPYFQIVFLVGVIYILAILVLSIYRKRKFAKVVSLGALCLILTSINDILYVNEILRTGFLVHYGIAILIFSQAFVLSIKFSSAFNLSEQLGKKLYHTNQSISRFVPEQFIRFLDKTDITEVNLGDFVQKQMCILFADIRDFTELSETMSPKDNFDFINAFLKRMEPAIKNNGGFIDKYIGDAVMALFPGKTGDALNAAIEMHCILDEYNKKRTKLGYKPIQMGIGLHSGDLVLGIIGSQDRIDSTVISDAVNLASRIEGLTKVFKSRILISEKVLGSLDDPEKYNYRFLDQVQVKGKSNAVAVFEILNAVSTDDRERYLQTKGLFERGIHHFLLKEIDKSLEIYNRILQINPGDYSALYYQHKCKSLQQSDD